MKKDCFKNFTSAQFVFKMILMLLAVVTGGGVLAMADTAEPTSWKPRPGWWPGAWSPWGWSIWTA